MRAIDLCCGLGGISLAAKELRILPLLGVDTCCNALKTYKANFPHARTIQADVREPGFGHRLKDHPEERKLGKSDLYIVSGPPCQGFSDAGSRLVDDPRNTIIVAVASLIALIRPKAAIIENVAAIRKPRYQAVVAELREILQGAGYHVCEIELNAADFGVPQVRRRRMFFITPNAVTEEQYRRHLARYKTEPLVIEKVFRGLPKAVVRPPSYEDTLENGGVYNHFAMLHSEKVKRKIAKIEPGKGPLSYRKLKPDGYAPTLISGHRAPPVHYREPRAITVREAARIQGFPDDFRICGSSGSQLQQVANAVPPNLAKAALRTLLHFAGPRS
ncbi:MAG: DNA cytosine methyltransferase [Sedimentisphaerales bacterium]|jgi:DNA (cytosine-5)-methyltransferase 1|nr:DNA cytosine methyltransferase [Sedimentisphaerales bacterium]